MPRVLWTDEAEKQLTKLQSDRTVTELLEPPHRERVQQEAADDHRQPRARVGAIDALAKRRFVSGGVRAAHGLHALVVPDRGERLLPEVSHGAGLVEDAGSGVDVPVGFDVDGAVPES